MAGTSTPWDHPVGHSPLITLAINFHSCDLWESPEFPTNFPSRYYAVQADAIHALALRLGPWQGASSVECGRRWTAVCRGGQQQLPGDTIGLGHLLPDL